MYCVCVQRLHTVVVMQLPEVHSTSMDIHTRQAVLSTSQLCSDDISCFAPTSYQNRDLQCRRTAPPHNENYAVDVLLAHFKGAESRLSVTPNSEVSRLRASTVLAFRSARASLVSLLPSPLENLSQSDSSSESLSDPKSDRRDACRGSRTSLGLYDTAKRSRCGVKWWCEAVR